MPSSNKALLVIKVAIFSCMGATIATAQEQAPAFEHRIYEALPPNIAQSTHARLNEVITASLQIPTSTMRPFSVIVPQSRRWTPGNTLTIAFNGGNDQLYSQIESAVAAWTQPGAANLTFSFKDSAGNYRHWSTQDKDYAADVRIAFASGQNGGYWSVIGTDSRDTTLEGGNPNQASMNFGGFDTQLPTDWAGTVRHEFGHALGFEHEHQSPAGGCDFRYDNDPGYKPTTDGAGWYGNDPQGRRPGLYTYLGGKANYWSNATVDANLRSLSVASTRNFLISAFDKTSIMKYYFDPAMFTSGAKSPCYTGAENLVLSAQDIIGVHEAYSRDPAENVQALKSLLAAPHVSSTLKSSLTQRLNIQLQDNIK